MISVKFVPNPNRMGSTNSDSQDFYLVNWRGSSRPRLWHPAMDLYETEDKIVARLEIAGMNEGDFSIHIDQHTLSIIGVRSDTNERRAYHQMEISFGEFGTEIEIPGSIEIDQVTAEYQDGFLFVTMPKTHPRHITINKD
jgi:HSP20 family protein